MKAQGNIIAPADPAVAATHIKLMIGTVTAPVKKKCAAIPETMKSRCCGTVLSGGCNQAAGGGEAGKVLMRQCVPEHGQAAFSLMVKSASPMPFHKVLPFVGVQQCPQACCGQWASVARPPSPINGITPTTRKTAPLPATFASEYIILEVLNRI